MKNMRRTRKLSLSWSTIFSMTFECTYWNHTFLSCMFFSSQLHQCCRRTSQLLLALCSWRPRLWMKHGRRPLHVRNRVCQGRLPRHWLIPHHQSWDHSRTLVGLFGKDFFWFSASLNVNIFWDKTLLGLMERSPQVMSITSIKKQFLGC